MSFSMLPDELMLDIAKEVPSKDLKANLLVVNKQFSRNAEEELWKSYKPSLSCILRAPELPVLQITTDLCLDTRGDFGFGAPRSMVWYGIRDILQQLDLAKFRRLRWYSDSREDDHVVFGWNIGLLARIKPDIEGLHLKCTVIDNLVFALSPFVHLKDFRVQRLHRPSWPLVKTLIQTNEARLEKLNLAAQALAAGGQAGSTSRLIANTTFLVGSQTNARRFPRLQDLVLKRFSFNPAVAGDGRFSAGFGVLKSLELKDCHKAGQFVKMLYECGALGSVKRVKFTDCPDHIEVYQPADNTVSIVIELFNWLFEMPQLEDVTVTTTNEDATLFVMGKLESSQMKWLEIIVKPRENPLMLNGNEDLLDRRMGFCAVSDNTPYPSRTFFGVQTEDYRLVSQPKTPLLHTWPEAFGLTGRISDMIPLGTEFRYWNTLKMLHIRKSQRYLEWGDTSTPLYTWDLVGLPNAPKFLPSPASADVKIKPSHYPQLPVGEDTMAELMFYFMDGDENDNLFLDLVKTFFGSGPKSVPTLEFIMYGDCMIRRDDGPPFRLIIARGAGDGFRLLVEGRDREYAECMEKYGTLVQVCSRGN